MPDVRLERIAKSRSAESKFDHPALGIRCFLCSLATLAIDMKLLGEVVWEWKKPTSLKASSSLQSSKSELQCIFSFSSENSFMDSLTLVIIDGPSLPAKQQNGSSPRGVIKNGARQISVETYWRFFQIRELWPENSSQDQNCSIPVVTTEPSFGQVDLGISAAACSNDGSADLDWQENFSKEHYIRHTNAGRIILHRFGDYLNSFGSWWNVGMIPGSCSTRTSRRQGQPRFILPGVTCFC